MKAVAVVHDSAGVENQHGDGCAGPEVLRFAKTLLRKLSTTNTSCLRELSLNPLLRTDQHPARTPPYAVRSLPLAEIASAQAACGSRVCRCLGIRIWSGPLLEVVSAARHGPLGR